MGIRKNINNKQHLYFHEFNKEFHIYDKELQRNFFVDFKYKNKIIEFYGDFWHKNPKIFNKTIEIQEKWEYDRIKEESIKNKYELLIIWESEYKNKHDTVINKCLRFLEL